MKKTLLTTGIIFGMAINSQAMANDYKQTSSSVPKNISIYDESGWTFVSIEKAHECSTNTDPNHHSHNRYVLSPEHSKYSAIYATLLAASISGKSISLGYEGCSWQGYGQVTGIYLK